MSLQQTIEKDFIEAYKTKAALKLSTLRMLKTAIANKKIAVRMAKENELEDSEVVGLIKSEIKKRRDAIEAYNQGGRSDLSQQEAEEMAILEQYLPDQLSPEAIIDIINRQAEIVGAHSPADFGKLMGAVMAEVGSRSDGQIVSPLVKKFLNQ
ncbi:MAG TPA: GatB/YqeY domain-containing protein [bacterium]|nr:GatB/YqeY domain-containing protein [bacterium]HPN80977.1 GatB/YqeY domain-containing protein [bacterium]HPW39361.1 GatB/YqeY domain-containing protein [bacterium]